MAEETGTLTLDADDKIIDFAEAARRRRQEKEVVRLAIRPLTKKADGINPWDYMPSGWNP
jgi:hypothetical protein